MAVQPLTHDTSTSTKIPLTQIVERLERNALIDPIIVGKIVVL